MFCRYCGKEIERGIRFCPHCGRFLHNGPPGQSPQPIPYQNPYQNPYPQNQGLPMRWYKFTIYIQLILSPIVNGLTGIGMFLYGGFYYISNPAQIALSIWFIIYGIFCIALAVFAIVTRQKLAHFKKDGPLFLFIFLGISLFSILTLSVSQMIITKQNTLASMIINLMPFSILLLGNIIYFKKRASLFCN